jgi:hypothetical protein
MKEFILFCKLVQPSPSSLQLPSSRHRHRHRSCRPRHRPHPRPPPSLPSPLPSSSPSPLLAHQPCHRLHRLAALTLLVACHPHRHHSRRRRHCPRCRSPRTLIAVAITLAQSPSLSSLLATLVTVVIALFVASTFTCLPSSLPSRCLGWGRGGPYRSGARSYFGRHHWCRHHCHRLSRPPDRPGGAGPTTRSIPMPGRQLALTWGGCCRRSCSRRHPPRRLMAVAAVAAAAACQRWRRRWCWQCSNKVNKDNDNNMTTTQQPT